MIHNAAAVWHCRANLVRLVAGSLLASALALIGGAGVASAQNSEPTVAELTEQLYNLGVGGKCLADVGNGARIGAYPGALIALTGPSCIQTLGKGAQQGLALFECLQRYTAATCAGMPAEDMKNGQGVSLDRYSGPPGTTVTARGSGFAPNNVVRVTQTGGPGVTGGGGTTQADGNGNVRMDFRVAEGTPPGTITIWFRQSDNIIANTKFEVTGLSEAR